MKIHFQIQAHCFSAFLSSALGGPPEELSLYSKESASDGLDAQIYPIGWTRRGNTLALLIAHPNSCADEREWELRVINLQTDEPYMDQKFRHVDRGGLPSFWVRHGRVVEAILAKASIQRTAFELQLFPALLGRSREESYETALVRCFTKDLKSGRRGIRKLKLRLMQNGQEGTKTVFKRSWSKGYPLAAGVLGYLANPLGDRIAILLGLTVPGFEGGPNLRRIEVVGARVGSGF